MKSFANWVSDMAGSIEDASTITPQGTIKIPTWTTDHVITVIPPSGGIAFAGIHEKDEHIQRQETDCDTCVQFSPTATYHWPFIKTRVIFTEDWVEDDLN